MASWISWLVLVVIAVALGGAANHYSVRTVRWFTAFITVALIVAVTTYGLGHPAPTTQPVPATTPMTAPAPPDLETAFARGADGIAAALLRPLWLGHQVPEPGRVGWVVILVLLALGYRQLESWAYRRQAPVLDTSRLADAQPGTGDGAARPSKPPGNARSQPADKRHDQLAAEVKFRVAAMDVRAPSLLPGGSRSNGLASIAEASGVQGGTLVAAIIQFFALLWPGPRRWQLRFWVEQPADLRVTVELDDARIGLTMAAKTLNVTRLNAASMIAGYVGRQVFASDPTSPPWCYGAADGNDLGALLIARQERVNAESSESVREARRRQIKGLQAVTRQSKCSGVVRYELAQLQDLEGNHLPALRLHALNREQYPRFFRGRYRLAMSLEMVTEPCLTFDDPKAARYTLTSILDVLKRCGLTSKATDTKDKSVKADGDPALHRIPDTLSLELLKFALGELQVIQRHLRLPFVLWAALRHRDERAVWRPHLRLRVRQAFRDGACVAELLVAVRILLQYPKSAKKDADLWRTLRLSHFRHAMRITAAIAGDSAPIEAVFRKARLTEQPAGEPAGTVGIAGDGARIEAGLDKAPRTGQPASQPAAPTERVRLLPWLRRTASWQAAYNTACIYSALAQLEVEWEDRVVASLQRAIDSPDTELERPYDWIACDPDFVPLKKAGEKEYPAFARFLQDQESHDYPGQPRTKTRFEHLDATADGTRDLRPAPTGTSATVS
jgi:hypothetical protein